MRTVYSLLLLVGLGCEGGGAPDLTGGDPLDRVSAVDSEDPDMKAAIEKARATVDEFLAALKDPGWTKSEFSVKVAFHDGESVEHMWLNSLWMDDGKIVGVVANSPRMVRNVRFGDETTVDPSQISDWVYVDDGVLKGAFTLQVLRDQASEEERAEFDADMPYPYDDESL